MRRVLATALAGAISAVVLGASSAPAGAAATPPGFFGVSNVKTLTPSELQRAAAGGVTSLRVQVFWGAVEPTPGARNWAVLDQTVRNAAIAGIDLMPFLLGVPPWVSPVPARPPIYNAQSRAAWSTFVTDLAARYGSGGTFWALNPTVPRNPITDWQIWNEVNLSGFWGGRPNPKGYATLVEITDEALVRGDPAARTVLSGLLPYKSLRGSIAGNRYLDRLVRIKRTRGHFDVVAVHPYGESPRVVLERIADIRTRLRRSPAAGMPIWVTEFGWTTGGTEWNRSPFKATFPEQARRVSETLRRMAGQRKRLGLRRVYYFSLTDLDVPGQADPWTARLGLFDLAGEPKPAWFAYVKRAGGSP